MLKRLLTAGAMAFPVLDGYGHACAPDYGSGQLF